MVLSLINYQIYKQVSGLKILLNVVNKIVGRKSSKLFWISPSNSAEEVQDDGSWSPWSSWSSCSTTCGEGAQRRTRDCADPPPSQGGTECPGSDEEMRSCETGTCPVTSSSNATSTDCKTVRYWDVLPSALKYMSTSSTEDPQQDPNKPCVFPFIYLGKTFNSCTGFADHAVCLFVSNIWNGINQYIFRTGVPLQ